MSLQLKSKIWREKEGNKVFGDGPCDILIRIERLGSLRQASQEIKMSYSQAWHLVKLLEQSLGFPLLNRKTGGSKGGYSSLTPEGARFVKTYYTFRQEAQQCLEKLFKKHFEQILNS